METKKTDYITPDIQLISLDTEVSLYLESDPPVGPGEFAKREDDKRDVFKDGIV